MRLKPIGPMIYSLAMRTAKVVANQLNLRFLPALTFFYDFNGSLGFAIGSSGFILEQY